MESSKVDLTAKLPYRVPPDVFLRSAMIFKLLLGICVLFLPFLMLKENQVSSWVLTLIPIALGLNLIRLSFRQMYRSGCLTVDENGIHHVAMFFKKRSIFWNEIDQIVTGTQDSSFYGTPLKGSLGKVSPSMGPYLMIITRKNGADSFLLNIKPYTMRGMATFVHFLTVQAKTAKIDEQTLKMMQGIFPSVLVGEAKAYW
jgi:hypothetical protein